MFSVWAMAPRPPAPGRARAVRPPGRLIRAVRVRRRYRAKRHPRARQAAQPPPALRADPSRGSLPRRGAGLPGVARWRLSRIDSWGACVGSGGGAFRPGACGGSSGSSPSSASRGQSPPSRRPSTTIPRLPAGRFSATCSGSASPSGRRGIVGQSTDTVTQSATLVRLFEGAKSIHVVRDGRDASASRVAETRGVISPGPGPRAWSGGRPGSGGWTPGPARPPDRL